MSEADQMAVVADLRERTVTAGGETLTIRPLKVGQLPKVLKAIQPLLGALKSGQVDVLELLAMHPDALLDAISAAINKPRAWLDEREQDELVVVATAALGVNADFFTQRVLPKLEGMEAALKQRAGPTPSSA